MAGRSAIRLAPSILSADAASLWPQVEESIAAGVDAIHVDIMDGQFVPNIAYGPRVVEALRRRTDVPLDVHMMVNEPGRLIPAFIQAGATNVTVHAEACAHLHRVVHQVKEAGAQVGVALNPATPVGAIEEVLADLDLVLVMTVMPGFGGQRFMDGSLERIATVRNWIGSDGLLEVDGGIEPSTASEAARAGANVLVAGTAVFGEDDRSRAIRDLGGG